MVLICKWQLLLLHRVGLFLVSRAQSAWDGTSSKEQFISDACRMASADIELDKYYLRVVGLDIASPYIYHGRNWNLHFV